VHLDSGDIEGSGYKAVLSAKELKVLLLLVYQWFSSHRGYIPARQIAQYLYRNDYYLMEDPHHTIEVYIHNIRGKLGDSEKRFIVGCRNKGYRLDIPKGCCSVPVQLIKELLENS